MADSSDPNHTRDSLTGGKPKQTRPSVRAATAIQLDRFIDGLRSGLSRSKAADYAGLSIRTVDRHREESEEFAARYTAALGSPLSACMDTIMDAIRDGDCQSARWLAERIDPDHLASPSVKMQREAMRAESGADDLVKGLLDGIAGLNKSHQPAEGEGEGE